MHAFETAVIPAHTLYVYIYIALYNAHNSIIIIKVHSVDTLRADMQDDGLKLYELQS